MTDERADPPFEADERATLTAFLDFQRATLALKCEGLTDDQLRERAVPPSSLSLLGLVRHMADVERVWFRRIMAGQDTSYRFSSREDRDGDFDNVRPDPAMVAEAWQAWREEIAFADEFVAAARPSTWPRRG